MTLGFLLAAFAVAGPGVARLGAQDAAAAVRQAKGFLQEDKFLDGLAAAQEAVRTAPQDYLGHYYTAYAQLGLGQYESAATAAKRALELAPADSKEGVSKLVETIRLRGQSGGAVKAAEEALNEGLNAKAARLYEQAWNAGRDNPDLGIKAAEIYLEALKQPVDAGRVLQQVRRVATGPAGARAVAMLQQIAEPLRVQAEEWVRQARASQDSGEQERLLAKAEEADPGLKDVHLSRAWFAAKGTNVTTMLTALKGLARNKLGTVEILWGLPNLPRWLKVPAVKEYINDLLGLEKCDQLVLYTQDLKQMREMANGGNLSAIIQIGRGYKDGTFGLERDSAQALKLFRMAAAVGDEEAQLLIKQTEKEENESWTKLGLPEQPKAGYRKEFGGGNYPVIVMRWIPAGSFNMGAAADEEIKGYEGEERERILRGEKLHEVRLSEGFWMAETETTQAQWKAIRGNNPSRFKGVGLPVEQVSWKDAVQYCESMTEMHRTAGLLLTNMVFRLPTEAEWEYACRAGSTGPYCGILGDVAWHFYNSNGTTHSVGLKDANDWGLRDMHGNVSEWCADWYESEYRTGDYINPKGPKSGTHRVKRGGAYPWSSLVCRSSYRSLSEPDLQESTVGFRVVLVRR